MLRPLAQAKFDRVTLALKRLNTPELNFHRLLIGHLIILDLSLLAGVCDTRKHMWQCICISFRSF